MKKPKETIELEGAPKDIAPKIKTPKTKNPQKRKWIISLIVFIVGILLLVAGIVCLIINASQNSVAKEAEYLMAAESWVLEDSDQVIWDFTEVGKGTLTTNAHENDYDFKWVLEDGKMKIETAWLYELNNEYDYSLDQSNGILTLTDDDESYRFVAQ